MSCLEDNLRIIIWALTAVAVLAIPGCEDGQPASCLDTPQGIIRFNFTRAGSAEEILGLTEITPTVESIERQSSGLTRYVLKAGPTYWLDLQDLGFDLPLTVGETYTVQIQHEVDQFLQTYGVLFSDDTGVRVVIESDWFTDSNNSDFNYIFKDGYGDTGIQVRFTDPGCDPRQVNSAGYAELFTWTLNFTMGTQGRTLFHREQATLGPYTVRVLKAQREFINSGREILIAPQFSWILMPTEDFGSAN